MNREMRTVRIEEVSVKSKKIGRGQTLWTNKSESELREWFYQPTDMIAIRFIDNVGTEYEIESIM